MYPTRDMRVYMDTCCLCRQFDDQTQTIVARESEAIIQLHGAFERGEHIGLASEVLEDELSEAEPIIARPRLLSQLAKVHVWLEINERSLRLASILAQKGIPNVDALHIALAYTGKCDTFVTTDKVLIRRMRKLSPSLGMPVVNPIELKL